MQFDDLDEDEMALMDEINVRSEGRRQPQRQRPPRGFRQEEPDEADDDISAFVNNQKTDRDERPPEAEEWDGGEGQPAEHEYRPKATTPSEGYKSIDDEKADLLNKIARLEKKGIKTSAKLTIYSNIEDIRAEFKRMSYSVEVDQSVKFQRRMLIACVSGVEFLNKKFDPFDLELDGWSENIMENQEDYDTVFEELFAKYRTKVNVAPEIKLMFMIGGSAMMFHLSKSMFKKFVSAPSAVTHSSQPKDSQRREMRGPGIDLSSMGPGLDLGSLMGTFAQSQNMMEEERMSDIISIASSGVKDIGITRKPRSKKEKKRELILN